MVLFNLTQLEAWRLATASVPPKPVILWLVWLTAELAKAAFAKPLLPEHLFVFALKRQKCR